MLRIKDNVDLKELEKFGFVKRKNKYVLFKRLVVIISVDIETKELKTTNQKCALNKLFDLIQAGLVEKV